MYNSTSGSDVIVTSNCIYDIILLIRTVENATESEKILVTGCVLICILSKQGFKNTNKETV